MRAWLVLVAALPLLAVGSGATAGTSDPPRNGLIAAGGAEGIYLVDPQGTKAAKVPGTVDMGAPAWSPDGTLLAVESWDDEGSNVYTIRPDGSDRRLVLKNAWSPSWSPDGTRLVVVRDGESSGILVTVRVDGRDAKELTTDTDGVSEAVWSPDGKWIAFVGGEGAVMLVSPKGGDAGMRRIADSGWNLAWSPDGSKLAFETADKAKGYRQEIVVLELATGRRATLASRPNHLISAPAWSPDGNQFAFLSSRPMPKGSSGGCGGEMPMDLWVMNTDGSKPYRLSEGNYSQPSWGTFQPEPAPSSQQQPKPSSQTQPTSSAGPVPIAGTPAASPKASTATKAPAVSRVPTVATPLAGRDGLIAARGRDAIYLIDPDRGNARKIPGTAKMAQPAWSPDGSLLAVSLADADGSSVYTIRPDGSHPQLVLSNASLPSWAPDGKRLFVARGLCLAQGSCQAGDDDSTVFMSVRPDGSDARKVTFEDGDVYDGGEPAWPPDGNWAAFLADEGANPTSLDSSTAAWSPDEKRLAFVSNAPAAEAGPGGKTTSGLWIVAADGGRPQLLVAGISGRPSWGEPAAGKISSG